MAIDWEQGNESSADNVYAVRAFDAVEQGRSIRRQNARLTILQLGLTALVFSMGLLVVLATMDSGPLADDNKVEAASACDLIGMEFEDALDYVETEQLMVAVQHSTEDLNLVFRTDDGQVIAMHSSESTESSCTSKIDAAQDESQLRESATTSNS